MITFGKVEMGRKMHFIPAHMLGGDVIRTQNNSLVVIPQMLGSTTKVKPLKDGNYAVITQAVIMPKEKPVVEILTEDELVAKYGIKKGIKFQGLV